MADAAKFDGDAFFKAMLREARSGLSMKALAEAAHARGRREGIEEAAAAVEEATVTITKMHGWSLTGSLATPLKIGTACAAEIRALLAKEPAE